MKTLLRSVFRAAPADSEDLFQRNYLALLDSGLGFETQEDDLIWTFVRDFFSRHTHVPTLPTIRTHFERVKETEVVDRVETIANFPSLVRGDFIRHLEEKSEDRKSRLVLDNLKTCAKIVETGLEVRDGKKKTFLKGAVDSCRYFQDMSHGILAPTLGAKLSGDLLSDTTGFREHYERVEADPEYGIGQMSGLEQMDKALSGAKKGELWVHAGFTGAMKCVTQDTRMWDVSTGRYRTVGEIYESGDLPCVHALDEQSWTMTTAQVAAVQQSGVREIYQISSESRREIRVSGNHPFMTPDGWVNAADLEPGSWVAVPGELPGYEGTSDLSDHEIAVLGYLIGDGSLRGQITLTNGSEEIVETFIGHLEKLGYRNSSEATGKATFPYYRRFVDDSGCLGVDVSRCDGTSKFHPWVSPVRVMLDKAGLYGCTAEHKHIPGELWTMSDRQVWLLLSALWSTDGCLQLRPPTRGRDEFPTIYYTSKSKQLIQDIQALLQRVGVPSTISPMRKTYKGERRTYWTVNVRTCAGFKQFIERAHVIGKLDEQKAISKWFGKSVEDSDWFPAALLKDVPDSTRCKTRKGGWYYAKWAKKKTKVQRIFARRLAKEADHGELFRKAAGNIRWERVSRVDRDGEEMTYDLAVPGPANFVANGFITHNSSLALHWAYVQAIYFNHNVFYLSLEMPRVQCLNIVHTMHSYHEKFRAQRIEYGLQAPSKQQSDGTWVHYDKGLEYEKIKNGQLDENEKRFLFEVVEADLDDETNEYGDIHLEGCDPDKTDYTIIDLRTAAEIEYAKNPFDLLFIDHMGLMAPQKHMRSTTENLNQVIRDVKMMALGFNRGMGMAIVGLWQISRDGWRAAEKADGRYNLTALSYANETERSADVVSASWIDDELKSQGRFYMQCLKSRDTAPFERFAVRVEFHCRRLLVDYEGITGAVDEATTKKQNEDIGNELDELFA